MGALREFVLRESDTMKIVVTGSSGFLGRALMKNLRNSALVAIGVSRRFVPGMLQVTSYDEAPGGDVLVHLGEASDRKYADAHAPSYERRALATLERLQAKGFERIVYASSAVLYGDQAESPRKVGDPVYQTDAYTRLKLASERTVLARKGAVARLSNLYGPGMAEGNVVSAILGQLPADGPIRVLDTAPVRDFLTVEDAARALTAMIAFSSNGLFNVGSGQGVSIFKLATQMLVAAGQAERKIDSIRASNKFSQLVLDIAQTETTLGWRPTVSLADGIASLVNNEHRKGVR